MKIVTADKMRQIDRKCEESGMPASVLMENAGKAVANEVKRIIDGVGGRRIVILVGPGNNGGDGLVAARYLDDDGADIVIFLFKQRPEDDGNYNLVKERKIPCINLIEEKGLKRLDKELLSASAVIDAIFGTGSNRPLVDMYSEALRKVSDARARNPKLRIIAVDLPSGLNADTGYVDSACLHADDTITLAFPKVGLFNSPGLEYIGNMIVADIGVPGHLADDVATELITEERVRALFSRRMLGANKGTFGRVLVVAGSMNYIGAAYLACSGAMRAGAGLVTLAVASSLHPILASKLTESTYILLPESSPGIISPVAAEIIREEINDYDVMLIGCGLGRSEPVSEFVNTLLLEGKAQLSRLVIDADALNILAETPDWWSQLKGNAVLTPHLGEMSRLVKMPVNEIQSNRAAIAEKAALEWRKTVVLKGACTIVSSFDGKTEISPLANPGLASAGTGDVLAGVIAGLAAQGLGPADSAVCGVYLHGQAGETVRDRIGDTGMIASDLLPALPLVIRNLKEGR